MATILLSAAGAMIGGGFGGTILGLSGAVIGRAVGATVGRMIDQRLLGGGSRVVETGRIDRLRLTGASEGTPVARLWGRMRLPGQVIWAGPFEETVTTRGGKGAPRPRMSEHSYTVSLAIALCEGEASDIARIWADGVEINPDDLNLRFYPGSETQEPDALIEAVAGQGRAPAYRGIAYVVIEDLALAAFGNRVPQFTFEVLRPAAGTGSAGAMVRGVALIPGTGEYALATTPVQIDKGLGQAVSLNQHSPLGRTDLAASLVQMRGQLPNCRSVSLVVSWFGNDLRCGECRVQPKVEQREQDAAAMPWAVSGLARAMAGQVTQRDGAPIYGGTPADAAVIEGIRALKAAGQNVMFYPFILMEQVAGNRLPDPYGGDEQPVMPWRGRITASVAPGHAGSPDGTAAVEAEVAAFMGAVQPQDFSADPDGRITCARPDDWGYRRMVLHYAHLCAQAGGVGAFCIGSEMVGLTTLRGPGNSFPAVTALRQLAADCRAVLGPSCKIGYAADWSEYFGYRPGNGDVLFHLDPLWADPQIDFVGIDNYLPLSDWREGDAHLDAAAGSVHAPDYLAGQVEGGEYFDWFYADPAHRAAQIRTPIRDDAHGEDWIWRSKDLRGWWSHEHHDRVGGVRGPRTAWRPGMKPIWFTELGCAAIDKGTNQPNKFIDRFSSESSLPYFSTGQRDDLMQMQYLRAVLGHWGKAENNPVSAIYGGPMIDLARAHVWAWDARPFPQFPGLADLWSDGPAYARGHWLNGRAGNQHMADVVAEICRVAGVEADVSGLDGVVRGYLGMGGETGRALLQPLMVAHGFDAIERDGRLIFRSRHGRVAARLDPSQAAVTDQGGAVALTRQSETDMIGRVRLSFVEAEGDYRNRAVEAILPDERMSGVAQTELVMALTQGEARHMAHRWLAEARLAQDSVKVSLPPSLSHLGAGDVVALEDDLYRLDHAMSAGAVTLEGTRIEPALYRAGHEADKPEAVTAFTPAVPVFPLFLDLPLIRGDEVAHAPHVVATATPWPGSVAVFASAEADGGYGLNRLIPMRAQIGRSLEPLAAARPGMIDRGPALRVEMPGGALASTTEAGLLSGANLMAIGDGSSDRWELFQFRDATPLGGGVWSIAQRLRGQAGTDCTMPAIWPEGSLVVLMNAAAVQLDLPLSAVGMAQHYRIGSARRPWDDPSFVARTQAFAGIGLRPYAPCHLRLAALPGGGRRVTWTRRTRLRGDTWEAAEVPLAEAAEAYLLRVVQAGVIRHEVTVTSPRCDLSAELIRSLAGQPDVEILIAQMSDLFGPGAFARMVLHV
ncbi:glycoside hydrolase TIM-barrel-like domain-containing protein [Paracoccus sp. p3-h83]|uniref:baseplate multidomain protein megatron n=1 Tax=Paracoccus sp. p3-h83 TaxID=3342805 RepID=UPI0035BABD58